ncbi:MAG: hypothetical protein KDI09_12605 [Halioglobus sp.]|nr:hypothetical protein [Halioglobus sp.]
MQLQFLCPRHRQWLSDNPHRALTTWLQSHDRAHALLTDGDWSAALAHAGCALETADIALQAWPHPPVRIINRYADNAALLAQLLRERGDHAAARAVNAHGAARLEALLLASGTGPATLRACGPLLRLAETPGTRNAAPVSLQRPRPRPGYHAH